MSTTRKITLGNGIEVTDPTFLLNHLSEYVTFEVAAQMINPEWTRHFIHKEIQSKRVFLGEVLIVTDLEAFASTGYNKGQKFYITKTEVERLKAEYEKRPKRKILYCVYGCGRQYHNCAKNPCQGRLRNGKSFRSTVEDAVEYLKRLEERATKGKRPFSEFNRKGEKKNFKHR